MQEWSFLEDLVSFSEPIRDMVQIYITYIRSILEKSCVIWHSSLTEEDIMKLDPKECLQEYIKRKI